MREASASEAASAFLHGWLGLYGVPSQVTSDNGASFVANLWKDMMTRLNIHVQYSALYRPQAIGMLERQHRPLKESLKAAIEDMGNKYQESWMDYLPLVLLGKNTAFQPDIGASPSEMTFGLNVRIPGQLLNDPEEDLTKADLRALLTSVRQKTSIPVSQPSRHNPPERKLPGIPENAKFAYTKQHQTTGLQVSYEGPFLIAERLSNSTVKLEVGNFKNGDKRYEVRHANDLKFAHPDSMAAPAARPALGRPRKPASSDVNNQTDAEFAVSEPSNEVPFPHPTTNRLSTADPPAPSTANEEFDGVVTGPPPAPAFSRPTRTTRNPNPYYVDSLSFDSFL